MILAVARILVGTVLGVAGMVQAGPGEIVPEDLCKMYVSDKLFNFTGINLSPVVPLTYAGQKNGIKYTLVASLCSPLTIDQVKSKIDMGKKGNVVYKQPEGGLKPNVMLIKEDKEQVTVVDIAYINSDKSKNWKVKSHLSESESREDKLKSNSYGLEISYDISDKPEAKELQFSRLNFKSVCLMDDDFDFYDERVENSNMIFQYNGKKACHLVMTTRRNAVTYFFSSLIILLSLVGLFLDKSRERISFAISSFQGIYILLLSTDLTIEFYFSHANDKEAHVFSYIIFKSIFTFTAIGFSYFSRYVSLFFLTVAATYAINWSTLYAITLIFKIGIHLYWIHLGSLGNGLILLALVRYSPVFREKYAFMINTAISSSFYLCFTMAFIVGWLLNIFGFNSYRDFGKKDRVEFKHWVFFILHILISSALIFMRVRKARFATKQAMERNAGLFRSTIFQKADGYGDNLDRDSEGPTIIAM